MKVLFMGTPDFAKESLEAIYNEGFEIIGVVTNPDRPKGRGMKMIFSPVKEFAMEKGIDVYQPQKVKNNIEFIDKIKELNPDVICVVAYGKILPESILNIPRLGCINVHGSLLPKYRGAAPIQWAVINGDKTTGITTMYMDKGMDTGDMILKEEVEIGDDETTGELWDRLAKVGGSLLVETLKEVQENVAPRIKQPKDYTIAPMLDKKMAKIDFENKTSYEIKNLVRGLNPIMGAYTIINDKKLKFWKVQAYEENELLDKISDKLETNNINLSNTKNGEIILADCKKGLFIRTKDGAIEVIEIQGENGKRMNAKDYLRGNKLI